MLFDTQQGSLDDSRNRCSSATVSAALKNDLDQLVEWMRLPSSSCLESGSTDESYLHHRLECHFDVLPQEVLGAPLVHSVTAETLSSSSSSSTSASPPVVRCVWVFGIAKELVMRIVTPQTAVPEDGPSEHAESVCDDGGVDLMWLLLNPLQYTRWQRRKKALRAARCLVTSPGQVAAYEQEALKDILLTSLILSRAPKLADVWLHRLWVWTELFAPQPVWSATSTHPERAHATVTSSGSAAPPFLLCSLISLQWDLDSVALDAACEKHPLSIHAWQYRRQVVQLCSRLHFTTTTVAEAPRSLCVTALHLDAATAFLVRHHSDSSCCSFLLDMLRFGLTLSNDHLGCAAERNSWLHQRWLQLLRLTASLLRQTISRGHESLWYLRLGLWTMALTIPECMQWKGGWMIRDELAFVEAHADLASHMSPWVSPCSVEALRDACTGGPWWHQWYSYRYALQFLNLMRRKAAPPCCA